MLVYHVHAMLVEVGKRALDSLVLLLLVSHHEVAGSQMQVLLKRSKCSLSLLLSHCVSPCCFLFFVPPYSSLLIQPGVPGKREP